MRLSEATFGSATNRRFGDKYLTKRLFRVLTHFDFFVTVDFTPLREQLSGRARPCQGRCRGSDSRFPLFFNTCENPPCIFYKKRLFSPCIFYKNPLFSPCIFYKKLLYQLCRVKNDKKHLFLQKNRRRLALLVAGGRPKALTAQGRQAGWKIQCGKASGGGGGNPL